MIRGPLKILRIEAILRGASRRAPAGLWITVVGLEHEPFTVLGLGLVVEGRQEVVWANAPSKFLRRRGWTVTRKRPLSVCFPLDELELPTFSPHGELVNPGVGVESVVVRLSTGIEMRQRIFHVAHESKRTRRFLPGFGRDNNASR
jgi:hypothetical protein